MIKFDEVSQLEFYTYLEDIKNRLLKDAPEWRLDRHTAGQPPQTFYHLGRWDFTKGKDQKWPFNLDQHVFAYTKEGKHFLLNRFPIQDKS